MRNHWAEQFVHYAERQGVPCERVRYSNGWLETAIVSGCNCFTKSVSYNEGKRLYFLGVDPAKLSESGDAVVLCGGRSGQLQDIFVLPWRKFFAVLAKAEPINTYRDREYRQYKFHVRDRDGRWNALFEGGSQPMLDVTEMRFEPKRALSHLQAMNCQGKA